MRFQVPQFIEMEDRIFGQLTLKQFIYLAGGGGLSFLVYTLLRSLVLAFVPIIVIMAAVVMLSFYKFNNRPFINMVESAFKYYVGKKLFIWKKEEKPQPTDTASAIRDAKNYASVTVPKISESQLKDLSWSLDIKESGYPDKNRQR